MTQEADYKQTLRYKNKVADLSSRSHFIKQAALLKAIASDQAWEAHAVMDTLADWSQWQYMDTVRVFETAAMYNRLDVVEVLSERFDYTRKGEKKEPRSYEILAAFDTAVSLGHYQVADYCRDVCAAVAYLDIQYRGGGKCRQGAIEVAIEDGDVDKVQYLMDAGLRASSYHKDVAIRSGHQNVVDILSGKKEAQPKP